jgi:mono/diheme cytochrome c family protein
MTNRTPHQPIFTVALVVFTSTLLFSQQARTAQDAVYTTAQAARGQALYAAQCASCHGPMLDGAQGPPLAGAGFVSNWQSRSLADLANKIRNTMPSDAPGTLSAQQTTDLVAHLLRAGGFPAGSADLGSTAAALGAISWPRSAIAGPAAGGAALQGTSKVYPPLGNMAQLMRGIFFPSSNLIFTVQTHDPAVKPTPPPTQGGGAQPAGFSWMDWGAGIYGGWEMVDNAAIALADASPLMLAPGIRCENGRVAPVTDPDWIKFTEQMIEVARRTYKASQSRSQDAVSEATGDLSDACAACHQAYRDVRVRGQVFDPNDPSNKANRCMSRVPAR